MNRLIFLKAMVPLLGAVFVLPLFSAPPGSPEVARTIGALGHEDFTVRRDAFHLLRDWSEQYPRHMLVHMARAYPGTRDMEITTRLEELMEPLAVRWLLALPPGFIGINMDWRDLPGGRHGVGISSVLAGHPASTWGLQEGDVILAFNGESITKMGSLEVFSERVAALSPGTFVELLVLREDKQLTVPLRLGPRADAPDPLRGAKQRYETWLRALARMDEDFDPTFPVGHFPLD